MASLELLRVASADTSSGCTDCCGGSTAGGSGACAALNTPAGSSGGGEDAESTSNEPDWRVKSSSSLANGLCDSDAVCCLIGAVT